MLYYFKREQDLSIFLFLCPRRLLFTEDSVLQHELGEGLLTFYPHRHQEKAMSGTSNNAGKTCSSYFIEPVEWMEEVVSGGEVTGKVGGGGRIRMKSIG